MLGSVVQREAEAAGQEREHELVQANSLFCGDDYEALVQAYRESHDELSAGFHAADSTTCGIDNASTACDTRCMSAAEVFRNATTDQVQTVYVSTFVQVGRFTAREACDMRRAERP